MSRNKPAAKTRSPLKTLPLAQAGDSLRDELFDLVMTRGLLPYLLAGMMVIFAGHEWAQWYWELPPRPVTATVIAVIASGVAIYSWRRMDRKAKCLRLGIEGEIAIAQELERLRSDNFKVFHDIPGDGFNIDHLLIGPPGLFVIETKTHSKKKKGENEITFDGSKIVINGHAPDRDPIAQVNAASRWIGELLERTANCKPPIRPVVLYPGWWVTQLTKRTDTWVLEPKAFYKFLRNEDARLTPIEVGNMSSAIEVYLRAKTQAAVN
jgi:hypothetical protein